MKRFLSIALVMILVVAVFAGCKSDSPAPAPADQPKEVEWPTGDVTVYIPNPAGSNLDLSCRIMLDYLTKTTGKTFIPTNEATGMGTLALQKLVAAKPDGLTLMFTGSGSNIQYHSGQTDIDVMDPSKVTIIAPMGGMKIDSDSVLCTTPDKPFKTWDEFVAYVDANPGKINYGTSSGTTVEIKGKLLAEEFGIADKVKMVYASSTEIPVGLLGGSIDVAVVAGRTAVQYLQGGQFVALAHFIDDYKGNDAVLKDIPDLTDLGAAHLYSTFPMYTIGPANMDPALVKKINDAFNDVVKDAEAVDRWDKMMSEYLPRDVKTIQTEIKEMDDLIKSIYK